MENTPTANPEIERGPEPAGNAEPFSLASPAAHVGGRKCPCHDCTEQRRKWREKARRRKAAATGQPYTPEDRPAFSIVPPVADPGQPAPDRKHFVPWTVDLVRPLIAKTVDLIEKWDADSLIAEAKKVSEKVAEFIATAARWDPDAKSMLTDGAAECAIKYLNASQVSAEYLPELKLGLAALSILNARRALMAEIKKLAAEAKSAPAPAKAA